MCGFIGCVNAGQDMDLTRALPYLARRGPDSWRLWMSADQRVKLLHTRLAIVDKDRRADQPFRDPDSGVTIAYTGEIYNFRRLKEDLSEYNFRTESDTEVIAAVYLKHGSRGFSFLKGMFSFALFDQRRGKVMLARDCIGKKPLYVARIKENVLFGSSVLALVSVQKKPPRINEDVLEYFWMNSFVPADTSVISCVEPVLPGQVVEIDLNAKLTLKGFLESKPPKLYSGESLEQVDETIGSLFSEAVRRRLADNPAPAVLLSGGIDSTLTCKVAKALCAESGAIMPLEVITLRSLIPLMNDEPYARFAAAKIKVRLRLVSPRLSGMGDLIMKAIDLQDEPLGMPAFFLLERLVNAAKAYGRILLTGDGADEVFLGYAKPCQWLKGAQESAVETARLRVLPPAPSWMSDWAQKTIGDVLVGHMLAKVDRAASEQGVEIRCPFLDWDLVSYARSLPFEILTQGERAKALLKNQLKDWPRWFLERPKKGFAYNLRWHWGLNNYAGLREQISPEAIASFRRFLPECLARVPDRWGRQDVWKNFEACWRLLVWSRFLHRVKRAVES